MFANYPISATGTKRIVSCCPAFIACKWSLWRLVKFSVINKSGQVVPPTHLQMDHLPVYRTGQRTPSTLVQYFIPGKEAVCLNWES